MAEKLAPFFFVFGNRSETALNTEDGVVVALFVNGAQILKIVLLKAELVLSSRL
jgi:hypothetical protein